MLLPGTETLHLAAKQGWALPAFAVYNLEMVQATVTAAEDADRPVLLLAHLNPRAQRIPTMQ